MLIPTYIYLRDHPKITWTWKGLAKCPYYYILQLRVLKKQLNYDKVKNSVFGVSLLYNVSILTDTT